MIGRTKEESDMGIKYFSKDNQSISWSEISREERFFCAQLFHDLQQQDNLKKFIRFLNGRIGIKPFENLEFENFKGCIELAEDDDWEIGYEVCFYRDLLFYHSPERKKIREINDGRREEEKFPVKRTFDLCLFSNDAIVIIEAKAQQGLASDQCGEFQEDRRHIKELFEHLFKAEDMCIPKIYFVVLASSQYLASKSFTISPRKDGKGGGVGRNFIEKNKDPNLCFITWKQIQKLLAPPFYLQVDNKYGQLPIAEDTVKKID